MATQFRKQLDRQLYWGAFLGYVVDVAVAFTLIKITTAESQWQLIWAVVAPLLIYIIQLLWSIYSLGKRYVLYRLGEKEKRIEETTADFRRLGMPEPDGFYHDVDEYLNQAAMDERMTSDARFQSAFMLGMLFSMRRFGPRMEALLTNIILEEAIARYGRANVPYEKDTQG